MPGTVANILTGAAATKTAAGTYAVTADFVPTDSANNTSLTGLAAGSFVIAKATPTITWATPANIVYLTALGATQLNATASVPGSFVYTPPAGTVLTAGAAQTLSVTFTPTDAADYNTATGNVAIAVTKATPTATLTVTNSPQTYTGSGLAATVSVSASSVPGTVANILTGGTATRTTAGTYVVTADFVPTDSTNYATVTGLSAGNFVIAKVTPTATLAVSNSPQPYSGSGLAATVSVSASSVPGTVTNILTGGTATKTTAGTYAVTADFVPTDSTNYATLTGLAAGNFVIAKVTPTATLTVSNSPQTYTGIGLAATVSISASSVSGTVTNILTGGTATKTPAGTYAVTADFVPTDTTNYASLIALSAGNFVIAQATPTATLTVTNSPQTYTGSSLAATVSVSASSVPGAVTNILTGGTATKTPAGTYAVTADFVPTDTANYATLTGLSAGNFVIARVTPTATLTVTNSPQPYAGSGLAATVGVSASSVPGTVANILTGGTATKTPAGTYAVTADFVPTDSTNYATLTALSAGSFVIAKATPTATLTVTNSPQPYTGSGLAATVSISASSVPGTVANILTGGAATKTAAGTYAVTADFVPTDSTNYTTVTGLAAGNFVIAKVTPTATLTVSNSPQPYTGSGLAATVSVTASSVPGTVANILTGGAATKTAAGTYAVTADFVPTDTINYATLTGLSAGNLVIAKGTPTATLTVSNSPQPYAGSGLAATVGVSASSVPGTVANILTGGTATKTPAGTYAVTADFVPTDTANYATLTGLAAGSFVIAKATPTATLTVTNSPQPYTGSGLAATVSISASSVPGTVANILTGGAATRTAAGTYAVTADFVPTDSTNYTTVTGLAAGNFVIAKATPTATLTVSNSPQPYTGSGLAATVSVAASSVPGTVANILTGGAATKTAAGTYAVTADFVPTDTANYATLTGLSAGNFVIAKGTPTATLTVSNSPQPYTGSGLAATVGVSASSVPGTVANILTGGAATRTGAGTYAVTADFVPTDTANYATLTGLAAGNFVIAKATPTITWATPANILSGTALSATQLSATASAPGSFVYTPAAGTVLPVGALQTLSVTFTPTDTTNDNSATANVAIAVLVGTPSTPTPAAGATSVSRTPTLTWTAAGAMPPLQQVQTIKKSASSVSSLTTNAIVVSAGSSLVLSVGGFSNGAAVPAIVSVKLDGVTSFTIDKNVEANVSGSYHIRNTVGSLPGVPAGSHTVTVTYAASVDSVTAFLTEVAGIATATPLDGTGSSATGTSAPPPATGETHRGVVGLLHGGGFGGGGGIPAALVWAGRDWTNPKKGKKKQKQTEGGGGG